MSRPYPSSQVHHEAAPDSEVLSRLDEDPAVVRISVDGVFVSDLRHFLERPGDAPGPAVRMARRLSSLVRVATAGPTTAAWVSALPCSRRPGRRPCPGRMVVARPEASASIEWRCNVCAEEGVITGWEDTWCDLRLRSPRPVGTLHEMLISDEAAATLCDLQLLDPESERLVFAARADPSGRGALMEGDDDDLEELAGCVAAEANHESDRRRQRRPDDVFVALSDVGNRT